MTNFGGVFPFNYLCNPAFSTWWFTGFDYQPPSLVYIYLFLEETVGTFMISIMYNRQITLEFIGIHL